MKKDYKRISSGIWKAPDGQYWVDKMINGTRHRIPCGPKVSVARELIAKLVDQGRRDRLFPEAAQATTRKILTLEDLIEKYELEISARVSEKTLKSYHGSDKHLLKFFARLPLHRLTIGDIRAFEAERLRSAARASVNRDLERIRHLLNLADRDSLLSHNPLRGQKKLLKAGRKINRYLTDDEEARLVDVCEPETRRIIEFAWRTGLRGREQMLLPWSAVSRGFLEVYSSKTKRTRQIPITEAIQQLLEGQRGLHTEWCFPNRTRSGPINLDNFRSRQFYPALRAAQIKNFRWHDLRHTFCSRLIMAGASLADVRDLAGHESIQTTMRYVYLSAERLRDSMDLL